MQAAETLLARVRSDSHKETVRHLFGLSSRLAAERARLKADQNLSDEGRRSQEATFSKSLLKNFAELLRPVRLAKAGGSASCEYQTAADRQKRRCW
jgi:hypothetical protein